MGFELDNLLILEVEEPLLALEAVERLLVVLGDFGVRFGVLLLNGPVFFSELGQVGVDEAFLFLEGARALDELEREGSETVGTVEHPEAGTHAKNDGDTEGNGLLANCG